MINISTSTAADINRHHQLARDHADSAIQHAIEAGRLLLHVKTQLMHGEWRAWLAANVNVSERQAQRYMRAATGRPPSRRTKNDTVSDLPGPPYQLTVARQNRLSSRWVQMEIPDIQADLI